MTGRALVLIGPMGAGKTSVGRRVARALDRPFTDTDKIVVRDHGVIADLFTTRGEAHFRQVERLAVQEALAVGGVVALGGGSVLDPATRDDLRQHDVVLLTVQPHIIASRIGGGARPLLAGEDPVARWTRIFDERRPVYEEVADITFDTSTGPLADVVAGIVDWVHADARDQEDA